MTPGHAHRQHLDAPDCESLAAASDQIEIAAAVAFLASDGPAFITGQTLAVNGGALVVGA
ncbi:SDR family oxidoreductase [Rhodococcus sp. MSC1_016]|jgi:NAD(P)-dependent dehydrogenase (short-subunit alcohol dehydrogenase family)|uniref:SDR family oxidoreductase n=1 Tax=Rhodococcus sp. MSC1_016 TaxID=2909266 RepID=UPI0035B25991